MNQLFDITAAIQEKVQQFCREESVQPSSLSLSPAGYRRLIELQCQQQTIGNLIIGCFPLTSITTAAGILSVVIDELLGDTEIVVGEKRP